MRLLKALVNSLVSGIFFSLLLALLLYDLNISLNFKISSLAQFTLFSALSYGLVVSVICLLIYLIFQFFLDKKIKITIISPSFLTISFSFLILLFLIIFRTNYKHFYSIFNPEIRTLLRSQMIFLLVVAVLGLITFYLFRFYRKSALFFIVYFALFWAAMFLVFLQRLNYPLLLTPLKVAHFEARDIDKKITIIGLEGLSFDFIIPFISEGKLPNFSVLVDNGSWGKLGNFSPNEPIVLNNSVNTGKYPFKHRQVSPHSYRLLYCKEEIEVVPRYIFFRQLIRPGFLEILPREKTSQPVKDIWKIFEDNRIAYLKRDWPYDEKEVKPSPKAEKLFLQFYEDLQDETSDIFAFAKEAFFLDYEREAKASEEKNQQKPQFFYFLLNGLNIVETYFYKYSFPELIGNLEQEEINKFGFVIEKYYRFYDQILGKLLASMKEDELLIVYSSHGIEPLPLWKRFVEWILGNEDVSAYHENAPDGVILFYGKGIARGKNIEGMRIIDIAPTLLYYLGLPVGRDMDGIVKSSVFQEDFTTENPIFYISSYEEISIKAPS
jgi:hypothetical protein